MGQEQDKNFVSHFLNAGLGTVISMLLGFISTPLITRFADPNEYGQFSIFSVYNDIAIAILFIGLDKGLVRFFFNRDGEKNKRSLLKLCVLVPTLSAIIVSIIYFVLNRIGIIHFKFDELTLCLLFVYVLVNIWNRFGQLMLKLTYRSKKYSTCTIIQKIVYVLIIIIFIIGIRSHYFLMMILAELISMFIAFVFEVIYTKEYWYFGDISSIDNKTEVFKYSFPFIQFALMEALINTFDRLVIEHYYTDYEVGIYASAFSLVAIFIVFKTIFDIIWVPMQTEHYVKNPDDKTFIQKGSKYLTIIMMFICINIIMFRDIPCYILGEQYRKASSIIPFMMLGRTLFCISDTTITGIDYSKNSYLHAIISTITVVVNIVCNFILVPRYACEGAAIASAISFLVYLVLRIVISNKYYYIDYDTKKMTIAIIITSIFAYVITFKNILVLSIISYIVCTMVFIVIYFKDIKEMILYFKESFGK